MAPTAEEVVAGKLSQFARTRRQLAHALARRKNVEVPDSVERFFAAVESGEWEAIETTFNAINGGDSSTGHTSERSPEVSALWPAIIDAFGVAEQVHDWPAQALLDYGHAVLGSLRPGMVYIGGTDNGRWIPELLNETGSGERHVVITQNGLADDSYLDYVRLQYDDQLSNLTDQDSAKAFAEYVADAERRLKHDQEHPGEPKQVRPGEEIRIEDGKTHVSGRVAVMSINEKLLQALMDKNPDRAFALQESFPFEGTYADALPLGPLMELRGKSDTSTLTAAKAAETVDYWRDAARRVLADPEAGTAPTALKSYSHDSVAAANLLAAHGFNAEAEQGYRVATQLWPGNPEPISHLAELLGRNGRETEARELLHQFLADHPDQKEALQGLGTSMRWVVDPARPPAP